MRKKEVINEIREFTRKKMSGESSGHDYWHAYLVWRNAKLIGKTEKADMMVVEIAALLHDYVDFKIIKNSERRLKEINQLLTGLGMSQKRIAHIIDIINNISYKGKEKEKIDRTPEFKIVQDADRLEAIGAIGTARNFMVGAKFDEVLHDPSQKPVIYKNNTEYVKAKGKKGRTVINHFYEKTLFLRDLMLTKTGKRLATHRHKFVIIFLKEFFDEWEGRK